VSEFISVSGGRATGKPLSDASINTVRCVLKDALEDNGYLPLPLIKRLAKAYVQYIDADVSMAYKAEARVYLVNLKNQFPDEKNESALIAKVYADIVAEAGTVDASFRAALRAALLNHLGVDVAKLVGDEVLDQALHDAMHKHGIDIDAPDNDETEMVGFRK